MASPPTSRKLIHQAPIHRGSVGFKVVSEIEGVVVGDVIWRSGFSVSPCLCFCHCLSLSLSLSRCLSVSVTVSLDHEPAYSPTPPHPPPPHPQGGFYHMVISGYLDHQSTQFRLSASELSLFVSVVLILINALYGIPNCDDLVS